MNIFSNGLKYTAGPVDLTSAPNILQTSCLQISIVDIESPPEEDSTPNIKNKKNSIVQSIASWNISTIKVHAYTLSDEEAEAEELDNHEEGDENLTACETLPLPHSSLHTSWENLILPTCIKQNLLGYAHSALLFTDAKVSPHIISWNRVILLHGKFTGFLILLYILCQYLMVAKLKNAFKSDLVRVYSLFLCHLTSC